MNCKIIYIVCLIPFIFLIGITGKCQAVNSSNKGIASGTVYDSLNKKPLAAATIAIYNTKDTSLISYTLTDEKGEFTFEHLPIYKKLTLVVSFIGYKTFEKAFRLTSLNDTPFIHIDLNESSQDLEDIAIKSTPPVRMNGDTLEFNADAFKLDPNAQTEDLLRVLPGITIWSDGAITVNGKEVHSLLVNGRPFFGKDFRVATQNIPKDVVEKVQVYQRKKDSLNNVSDSSTEINIQLKNGKDFGYFGKLSAGYSTKEGKYDLNASTNYFNKRTQVGAGYVNNNINKVARSMDQILVNNTFKDTKANTDYQSNFMTPGLNRNTAGGILLQEDFIPKTDNNNVDRLNFEIFGSNNNQEVKSSSQTITSIGNNAQLIQQDTSAAKNISKGVSSFAQYEKKKNGDDLIIQGKYSRIDTKSNQKDNLYIQDDNNNTLSSTLTLNSSSNSINNEGIDISLKHSPLNKKNKYIFSDYYISYHFLNTSSQEEQNYWSNYNTLSDTSIKQELSRLYYNKFSQQNNYLTMSLPNIMPYISKKGALSHFQIGLRNDFEIRTYRASKNVKDKDSIFDIYLPNSYLTNNRNETDMTIKPSLNISKKLLNQTTARFIKDASLEFSLGPDIYILNSFSQNESQQFSKRYRKLIGSFALNYENTYFSNFSNKISWRITNSYQFPTVEQIAPLIDSANPNFIKTGNPFLKEQNTQNMSLSFAHNSLKNKNNLSYELSLSGNRVINYITYRNKIDALGRTTSNLVNLNGYLQGGVSGNVRKNFKMKNCQIQFQISSSYSIAKTPIYINDTLNYFRNNNSSIKPILKFEYKDILVVNFSCEYTYYGYKNVNDNTTSFFNKMKQSEIGLNVQVTKKLFLSSNVIYTENIFNSSDNTKFTIWNVSTAYRLFKDNRAEIRFSALDLLHQNTGIVNYSSINSITQGQTNVLRRYFMLTLAWYPRKFGK